MQAMCGRHDCGASKAVLILRKRKHHASCEAEKRIVDGYFSKCDDELHWYMLRRSAGKADVISRQPEIVDLKGRRKFGVTEEVCSFII